MDSFRTDSKTYRSRNKPHRFACSHVEFAGREIRWHQNAPPYHGLRPVGQTLTCWMALASAADTKEFSSEPRDCGRRFIQSD
jgi:hypothetical protein